MLFIIYSRAVLLYSTNFLVVKKMSSSFSHLLDVSLTWRCFNFAVYIYWILQYWLRKRIHVQTAFLSLTVLGCVFIWPGIKRFSFYRMTSHFKKMLYHLRESDQITKTTKFKKEIRFNLRRFRLNTYSPELEGEIRESDPEILLENRRFK